MQNFKSSAFFIVQFFTFFADGISGIFQAQMQCILQKNRVFYMIIG